ncbi:hypothetical protein ACJMK2_008390 [Sinanodonta woodiana]|uniref:Phosphatidylinositol N-acetylglucosaminyltransferase subunit P n=1 Tax=Sinanodonta woodiana TaxID=1069815 RepID=A0ABD3VLH1_SINWO
MAEHSPSPTPERAIYGFVLYLTAYVGFVVYLVWAYVPDQWLDAVGLSYWPQKYWAIAMPCYSCVAFLLMYPLYLGYVFLNTPTLDSMDNITDDYSPKVSPGSLPEGAIPLIGDLSISEVNHRLYM